jgi:hypothetical protein
LRSSPIGVWQPVSPRCSRSRTGSQKVNPLTRKRRPSHAAGAPAQSPFKTLVWSMYLKIFHMWGGDGRLSCVLCLTGLKANEAAFRRRHCTANYPLWAGEAALPCFRLDERRPSPAATRSCANLRSHAELLSAADKTAFAG